jgi:ribosomal protein S18 acetylase RimI-like enzyme
MNIRHAVGRDVPAIIKLMREFAEYENLLDFFEITEDRLSCALFDAEAFVNCLVAEIDKRIFAYAIFYPNFSTFRGQLGMYLEDIYISPEYRGEGTGEAILREVAKIAKNRGCERIDFQVLEWNEPAIAFYQKLGAVRDDTERHFKFTDSAFRELAG